MSDPWLMDPAFAPSAEVSSTHDAALAAYQRETEGVPVLDGPHWCREHGRMELPGGHEPDPEDADLIDLRDAASDWFGKDEAAALITKVVADAERRGRRAGLQEAAQVADDADKSTHPADLATAIRALAEEEPPNA